MLTWKELREQAHFVIENCPSGDFQDFSFTCRSGGAPINKIELPEVHRSESFAYRTTANGSAYRGEVVIRARRTGAKDVNGNEIYEAENKQLFIYRHVPGDPYSFDYGVLEEPKF